TTYRHMAEEITDAVCARLGVRRRCRTRDFPLDGTPREPWAAFAPAEAARLGEAHGLDPDSARHLVGRYGRRAGDVAAYLDRVPVCVCRGKSCRKAWAEVTDTSPGEWVKRRAKEARVLFPG